MYLVRSPMGPVIIQTNRLDKERHRKAKENSTYFNKKNSQARTNQRGNHFKKRTKNHCSTFITEQHSKKINPCSENKKPLTEAKFLYVKNSHKTEKFVRTPISQYTLKPD